MAYIYRIKNKITKKSYIGESKKKDVNWRWSEHKKNIKNNKGCPALRDAVIKYGIENFEFSVIIVCFDDDRFIYEKEYIKKYNTVVPNGYNITKGGEGGGFQGKKHTEQVKADIRNKSKQKYIDNPELRKQISERNKIIMKNPEIKEKIKNGLLNSEKWKKAKEENRAGNYKNNKHSEEMLFLHVTLLSTAYDGIQCLRECLRFARRDLRAFLCFLLERRLRRRER
jgi:group I intron endonuclease